MLNLKFNPAISWLGLISVLATGQATANCYTPNQMATAGALGSLYRSLYKNIDFPPGIGIDPPYQYPIDQPFPTPIGTGNNYDYECDSSLLQSITPDQVFAMGSLATRVNGGKITQPSDYFGLKPGQKMGSGAGDADFPPLSFWSKIDSDFGSTGTTVSESGYDFNNHNFMFGADYRLLDNWVAGGSFAYRHNTAEFDAGRGETTNDTYTGTIYTAYNITDAAYVNASASYGGFSYDTRRNITFFGDTATPQTSTAKATPDGGQYAFSWGGGYDFRHHGLTVSPYARGEYMNLDIDAYSESGSDLAMRFGEQNIESLISTVGVQTNYVFSFPWGVLIPQLRGEWHHQFMDGRRQLETGFVNDSSNQTFTLASDGATRDYYTFGAEVSSVFQGGISAFLAYETLQGYSAVNSNKLMLGARLEF